MKRKPLLVLILISVLMTNCVIVDRLSTVLPASKQASDSLPPSPTPGPSATPTIPPETRIDQAGKLLFEGDPEKAQQEFQAALESTTDEDLQAEAQLGIGRALFDNDSCQSAIPVFENLITNFPNSIHRINAYYFLGRCFSTLVKPVEAAEAYKGYLHFKPGYLDAYMQELLGDELVASNNFIEAASAYDAASQASQLSDPAYTEVKAAQAYASAGDHPEAIRRSLAIYDSTQNEFIKAQTDYLAGVSYLAMGIPEQAYARFQDAVNNYPRSYYSYLSLVELVQANIPVDDLNRGLVNYFVNQYGLAMDAFQRYMVTNPAHDGTPRHYKALCLRAMGDYAGAIQEWNLLIANHPDDRFFWEANNQKAYTQWAFLERHQEASQTFLEFVRIAPGAPEAPRALYDAARILERIDRLEEASLVWERIINEYPSSDLGFTGLFLAGISRYRLGQFDQSRVIFQRMLVLATNPQEQSIAHFWIGKSQQKSNNQDEAKLAFEQSAQRDPTGYYSERAIEVLQNITPFTSEAQINLDYDLAAERRLAGLWMRTTFALPQDTDLENLDLIANDPRYLRGVSFWELGEYAFAVKEFESLRLDLKQDAVNSFRLLKVLLELDLYRSAIFTSRQILDLAGLDDAGTFSAPEYFNHIRFGVYFKEQIQEAAKQQGINPLFLLSVIRQESMFDSYAQSSSGARGLMQIMPATGQEIVGQLGWPPDYTPDDLYNPRVNIRLGAHYLARQRNYFDGNLYAALAAYNGGPGNTIFWTQLSQDDPDLLLEVIRLEETRLYIRQIAEFMQIYRRLYEIFP